MDVPELDDELINQIVDQSNEQSGQYTANELEKIRDDNLVAILKGLQSTNWGAGKTLQSYRSKIQRR